MPGRPASVSNSDRAAFLRPEPGLASSGGVTVAEIALSCPSEDDFRMRTAGRTSSVACLTVRCVRVERNDTPVMFVAAEADPSTVSGAAQRAFTELESRLVTLRGRRFFGVFDPASREYLACVQTNDGDDPDALGLRQTVIPGGSYLRATITGQPPAVYAQIGPTFEELEKHESPDLSRPLIEFYRRHHEIDLLVPVA